MTTSPDLRKAHGRYRHISRNERICNNCTENKIEDELHFLISCSKYNNEREKLFRLISSKTKNFNDLPDNYKLYWILNCEDQEILDSVGRFLHENLP